MRARFRVSVCLLLFACSALAQDFEQKFANLGDFQLESGAVIRNCRVGYRTAGTLNAEKSNVILVPTWFSGKSEQMRSTVGEGRLYDTAKYFVVVVDALGNAVSSSPSNSAEQPGAKFPRITIRDMVRSQYELLKRELKVDRVYAVSGISMGGMQTFQWVVSYPDFMAKAIPITGTPKQSTYDLLVWQSQLDLLESTEDPKKAFHAIAAIQALELRSPEWIVKNVKNHAEFLANNRKSLERHDPFDYMVQLRAMMAHDIGAVTSVKPRMLVVVALQDEVVHPAASRDLARAVKADVVMLSGDCGHVAPGCEAELLRREVSRFLSDNRP